MNANKKKKTQYNFLKASVWYTLSNILIKGVSFFVLPVFTNLMTPEEYGIYSIYVSYLTIFEAIVLFGLSSTVRVAKYAQEVTYEEYISTIITIPPIITAIFVLVVNVVLCFVNELLSMNMLLWNFLLITCAISGVASIICAKLTIDGRYKLYTIYALLYTVVNVGLSLLLCYTVFRNENIYLARVIGMCAASGACLIFLLAFSKVFHKIKFSFYKFALKWGFPLLLHTFATVVLTQSDRIIINYISGYANAGIYSIAVTFITIPLTLYTSLENAWAPWFYSKLNENNFTEIKKFNNYYIFLFFLVIVLFILVSPDLIRLFTDEAYWDSRYSLIPLSISVFFELMYGICVSAEYFYKKTWTITLGTILTVLINIGLDILFVYLWGYVAAAYATVISKILLFIFHYIFSRRVCKEKTFSLLLVVGLSLALFGIAALSLIFVNNFIVRIVCACLVLILSIILIVRNKNQIKNVLKGKNSQQFDGAIQQSVDERKQNES